MKLNELQNNKGATKGRTRVGRGMASGKGRTAGRGMKGQKSRSGVAFSGFEGGQMPIHRRVPKRGFNNIFRTENAVANLGRIQKAIDEKRLDASKAINGETLLKAGVIGSLKGPVKLLAKGDLKAKITITVDKASAGAVKAVEKAGGKVTVTAVPKIEAEPKKDKTKKAETKAEDVPEADAKQE